jgi:hypothetical protein
MKTNFNPSILILLIISLIFTECKKEATKTKTELLCSSKWVMKSFKVNPGIDMGGGFIIYDYYSLYDSCEKDDTEKYETNGFGISDVGADKCDSLNPQTRLFTWSFKNNETILNLDGSYAEIITLNDKELSLQLTVDGIELGGIPGTNYKLTLGYKH